MNNSDQDIDGPISFYERYADYTDQQIKEILRNHKNYQEKAVAAAVKIAIERELIHNEQDLMAPEYQVSASEGWTLFPEINNAFHHKKMVNSIFRILFFASLLPIVYGMMKYSEGLLPMTYLGVGMGLVWLALTIILLKTEKLVVLFLQVLILLFVFGFVGNQLFRHHLVQSSDVLIWVIGTMVLLYLLLYLRKLIQTKPE